MITIFAEKPDVGTKIAAALDAIVLSSGDRVDFDHIQKYEKQVIEQMNYRVNADAGSAFFGIMGPFSPMPDGTLFYETCLDAVCNVINQELDVRLEKMQKRTGKYTKKYYKPRQRKKSYHGR